MKHLLLALTLTLLSTVSMAQRTISGTVIDNDQKEAVIQATVALLQKDSTIVARAHKLGMSTNVWTVNKPEQMQYYIDLGINAITTNEPMVLRELLGDKEFKL